MARRVTEGTDDMMSPATTLTTAEIVSRLRALPAPTRLAAAERLERLTDEIDVLAERVKALETELRSTICPAGGWTGQPEDMEPTVANCLATGECGCSVGAVLAGCSKSDERDASHG